MAIFEFKVGQDSPDFVSDSGVHESRSPSAPTRPPQRRRLARTETEVFRNRQRPRFLFQVRVHLKDRIRKTHPHFFSSFAPTRPHPHIKALINSAWEKATNRPAANCLKLIRQISRFRLFGNSLHLSISIASHASLLLISDILHSCCFHTQVNLLLLLQWYLRATHSKNRNSEISSLASTLSYQWREACRCLGPMQSSDQMVGFIRTIWSR